MTFYIINQIFVFLIVVLAFLLGFWIYFANKKSNINKSFLWMTIFLSLWILFCYFGNASTELKTGLFLAKLAYGTVALFFMPFYFFTSAFLEEEKIFPVLNKLIPIICISLALFTIFSNSMAQNMQPTEWGAIPVLGPGKYLYFSTILFLSLFITSRLLLGYLHSSSKKRIQIQYFLIGLFVFITANLIFNVILPFFQKIPQYYQVGNYSAIFLLALTSYAMVKQELFGIKIVLTALLVGLISILIFLDMLFLTQNPLAQLFKALLLVIFAYFGHLLIKSVTREILYRERLQKAYKDLQKLDKAKSEFISIASHQLRTPLSAIKGYVSMLSEGTYGELPERAEKPINNVYRANERLIKLVNDLLNLSRIEAGKIELKFEKNSLEEIINETIYSLERQAKKKNLYVKFNKPKKSLPDILIDRGKMMEILTNLVDNAIKYTTEGGVSIMLQTENIRGKKNAVIKIIDTGSGMTKQEISKIFKSFSRGMTGTKLYTEGAGLGLYIAKKFIQLHDGKIKAESKGSGHGSTFTINIPFKKKII